MIELDVDLHEGQQRAQDSLAKVIAVIAGTGGGKTAYVPIWVAAERERLMKKRPNHRVSGIVVAPYKILRRTTMPTFLNLFQNKLGLGEWESRQDGIWRFNDGGYVYFCSADTPESIEGAHVDWAVLDEAGQRQFPEESFRAVERRVRFNEGRILITTTPYVLGWLKELADSSLLPEKDPRARKDVEVITFASTMNPKFPKEEFERARATLPPWMFRMFYEGIWDRPAGLVYAMLQDEHWINWDELPDDWKHWAGYAGMDFGYHNPHAIVYATVSPHDGRVYVFDEYYEVERTNAQNAREAPHKQKVHLAWGDPSSPEAIAEFINQGWRLTAAPRVEVLDGLKNVFERILSAQLIFVRGRLEKTGNELDAYMWDEKEADKVIKDKDHAMDALRYLCVGLKNAGIGPNLSTFYEQPASPGRMSQMKFQDPATYDPAQQSSKGIYMGSRSGSRSRLAGLPRRSDRRY